MVPKKEGNRFENIFQSECLRQHIKATRFPDGCRRVGPRVIPVKTPWDWIVTRNGRTAFIDTKTQAEDRFPNAKINKSQVKELYDHELAGAIAGYVVWLRVIDTVIYIPASLLINLIGVRGSICPSTEGVIHLGPHQAIQLPKIWQIA